MNARHHNGKLVFDQGYENNKASLIAGGDSNYPLITCSSSKAIVDPRTLLLVQVDEEGNIVERTGNGTMLNVRNGLHLGHGFPYPYCLAFGPDDNLYVACDSGSSSIFKVTPDGTATLFATELSGCYGLAFDSVGNLYLTKLYYNSVLKVTPEVVVTTFASGFNGPRGLAFDLGGNLYVANYDSNTVSKVTPGGVITTFASGFNGPYGLAFDADGNLYVSNLGNGTVSKVTPDGVVTDFATGFSSPYGLTFDTDGNLYVINHNGDIYKVDLAGTKSAYKTSELLITGRCITFGPDGNLYAALADRYSSPVLKILPGVFVDHTITHDGYGSIRNTLPESTTPAGYSRVWANPTITLSGDFTIEGYLNPLEMQNTWLSVSSNLPTLSTDASGYLTLYYGAGSIVSSTPISVGEFIHIAWCRVLSLIHI